MTFIVSEMKPDYIEKLTSPPESPSRIIPSTELALKKTRGGGGEGFN